MADIKDLINLDLLKAAFNAAKPYLVRSVNGQKPNSSTGAVTIPTMKGATSDAGGSSGLVPAPAAGDISKFLRADGTWGLIDVVNIVYPIGSLYWSKNPTNPAKLFGGTWVQIKDKFILAAGDNYAVGATGGAATVTLTTAQIPAHSHSGSSSSAGAHTHTTKIGYNVASGSGYGKYMPPDNDVQRNDQLASSSDGSHSHTISIGSTGSGQAHNNMPPYVTYYCWERTA